MQLLTNGKHMYPGGNHNASNYVGITSSLNALLIMVLSGSPVVTITNHRH